MCLLFSFQGPWAKHLVKWLTPFQSLTFQEPWPPQRMRKRKKPWRPCSRGWPRSAARGHRWPSRSSHGLSVRCAHTALRWQLFYVSLALHLCYEALLSGGGSLLISLHTLQRCGDFSRIVLERWCNKCIIFRSINISICFAERAKNLVFSQNTSENRVHCLNAVGSVHFFVCKTLYKWILINFCCNTWSHFRLSCVMKFQGVVLNYLPVALEREEVLCRQAYGMWKLSRRGFCPVDTAPHPTFAVMVWELLSAFCDVYPKGCL